MEKKKVVSSEISSGTDKIITLQEKERIEKRDRGIAEVVRSNEPIFIVAR
jgi:hypothetical protein